MKYFVYNNENLIFEIQKYHDNSLALLLIDEEGELYADLTVNLGDQSLNDNQAYVDTNNLYGIIGVLEDQKIATFTNETKTSGFCEYPKMDFDLNLVKEFGIKKDNIKR